MIKSVLVVARHLIYGGTERYTVNLVNALSEKGITVTLITGDGPLTRQVSPNVNMHIMPIRRDFRTKQIAEKRILEIARIIKPQLIHTQCRASMLNAQLTRDTLNIPVLTHEHHMYNKEDYPFIVDEIRDGADHILTVGPYAAKALIDNGLRQESISTILNGVDVNKFRLISKSERKTARSKLKIKPEDKVILCLSRLEPGKGIDKLALAFIKISKAVPNSKLYIVGDDMSGETDKFVQKIIIKHNLQHRLFRLKGDQDIRKYHAIADVFCYPALGKGMAVMEAMSAGLSVVGKKTTRKPLVVENGISGLLTNPTIKFKIDPDALSTKLTYLLKNPDIANKMGKTGRNKIKKDYNLNRVVSDTLSLYQEVVDLNIIANDAFIPIETTLIL